MKITMTNKDHIARLISDKAYNLPTGGDNDTKFVNMLRVSEALLSVGETGSSFRSLNDFKVHRIPAGEDVDSNVTYFDALKDALSLVGEIA